MEKEFTEKLHNLKRFYVPKEMMLPLLCYVLKIKVNEQDLKKRQRREKLIKFGTYVNSLVDKYCEEIGPNGYAALNVLTEFSTRPNLYISSIAMIDQLQKRTGDWVSTFLSTIKNDNFNFESYLGDYMAQVDVLNRAG